MAKKKKQTSAAKSKTKAASKIAAVAAAAAPPMPIVILGDAPAPTIAVRNNDKTVTCVNLDTRGADGLPEDVIWGPRGRDDIRYLTHAQIDSRGIQKLIKASTLEIRREK